MNKEAAALIILGLFQFRKKYKRRTITTLLVNLLVNIFCEIRRYVLMIIEDLNSESNEYLL